MGRPTERDKARRLRYLMRLAAAAAEKREREALYQAAKRGEKPDPVTLPGPVRRLTPAELEAYARTLAKR